MSSQNGHAKGRSYTLKIWRQKDANSKGALKTYKVENISPDASFLEMLDVLNEDLERKGEAPIVFEHDCREGICGTCGLMINGRAHGPKQLVTTCQLHMREFADGATITIEPWRAAAFPVVRDLAVDRAAFDRIIEAGGYISVDTGSAPDANAIPVAKSHADSAFDAATCIGCGACVAVCPNASAMLFTSAKISHLAALPQGEVEHRERVLNMVATMDEAGFGNCSNVGACAYECPKGISLTNIAKMNRDYFGAALIPSMFKRAR